MDNQQLREMFGGPVTCELCFHDSRGFQDQEKKWSLAKET